MGSIAGALVAAVVLGLVRGFGTIGFPLFTDGLMYLFMIVILLVRPSGLFGREVA
jgi:branched-chain amino acid transport system permease protein